MGNNKINCKICATLQVNGREINFNGDEGNNLKKIKGTEAIVIHNENVVLGMQKPKRWYDLENGERATIIKTLGGQIEKEDKNSSKKALIREILEEVQGIEEKDLRVTEDPIFTKRIRMGDLNIFERESDLKMEADFYLLEILSRENIAPNDLPALLEIPVKEFLKLEFIRKENLNKLKKYIIKNIKFKNSLPEHYALMVPEEVKEFLKKTKEYEE